jgi:ferritin-like metal-binding protein YciE
LKDLYNAETQITKALPKMASAATVLELQTAFREHLEQTKAQKQRIEDAFKELKYDPKGKKCVGMDGLIKEGDEILAQAMDPDGRDTALIGAAQKVEHYEISGYGTARAFAGNLGLTNIARLLQTTLDEEAKTDNRLTSLAESHLNRQARQK